MALPITNPNPPFSGSGNRNIPYRIETINLSYKILGESKLFQAGGSLTRGSKFILKNVNCEAKAGEMTAIVGPSGAGKTTLLEILGGKTSEKNISGRVLVNDQPVNDKRFQRILGYVTQDDALFPLLTVEETLMYSALLRLHGGDIEIKVSRVRELVKELGLEKVAASKIGRGSNWGISGGERRRVSIGIDLVHDPPVILIDEPTSGLDSVSALHVISVLKRMTANQGKTIVLTIHQPGFRIIQLFDRLVLLSNGFVVHNDSLNCLEERLRLAGHIIPHRVNALEYSMDVLDSLAAHSPAVPLQNPSFLQDNTSKSSFPSQNKENPFSYANPRIKEILILGQRFCRNIFRTKQLFATRIIQASVAGLILGTIFLNNGNERGQIALQTRLGFFAFSLTFLLSSTAEGLPIFLQERRIIMGETSRGAYRISSYVLANTLVFLPFLLMVSLFYATSVYWLVGLRKEIFSFLYFCLVVWMVVLMSNSLVACCSALVPNFIMGTSIIAGLMGSFFLFSGYFISKQNIPSYWIFMHYLSLFKYPFECFMINEYGGEEGRRGKCLEIEAGQCRLYGGEFLAQQGLKESQKWSNLAVMLGFIIGYRVLSFLILWYRCCRNNRN